MTATDDLAAAIRTAFGDAGGADVALEPMTGGKSGAVLYTFRIDGTDYVIRKSGTVNPHDPDRPSRELACIRIAADLGVAPRLVFGDAATGITIMAKITGTPIGRGTSRDDDPLARIARTLRVLHRGPKFPAGPGFTAMFGQLDQSLQARGGSPLPAMLVEVMARVTPLVEHGAEPVSCHRDLNPTNILATPFSIHLVDWEVAGLGDPFLDLAQLGIWVCVDADERYHLLESYLERAPSPDEVVRAQRCRVLAIGFYAAAFHLVSMFAGRTVAPAYDDALDRVFARMATTGQPFAPDEMAAALVSELAREARVAGLLE